MPADLNSLGQQNLTDLKNAKSDFLDAIDADRKFIDNYGSFIAFDFEDTFKAPLNIALQSVDTVINSVSGIQYEAPTLPSILNDPIVRAKDKVYLAEQLDNLEANFKSIYDSYSGPNGLTLGAEELNDAIQTAMYGYEYELDEDDLKQDIDSMAHRWAADGYTQVPGAMTYDISTAIGKFDRMRTSKTKDIFGSLAETIQKNLQYAFENGISLEKLHMDFTARYSQLLSEQVNTAVAAYLAEIQKRKGEIFASLRQVESAIDTLRLEVQGDIKQNELELDQSISRTNAHISNFGTWLAAESSLVKDQIEMAANISSGYQAIFSAWGGAFTGLQYEKQAKAE